MILMLCILVGVLAGFAAVALKGGVHLIQNFVAQVYERGWYTLYYVMPLLGVVLTAFLTNYVLRDRMGHGITQLLYSISKKHAIIARKRTYSFLLSSAVTVGMGGSVGLEAPIVVTGSAIASRLASWMQMGYRIRLLLIGCGAAGAISGIFNSPVAGMLFAIEVILVDVTIFQFIPVLIASALGAVISQIFTGDELLFSFTLKDQFSKTNIPYYILLGGVCGFISLHFMRMNFFIERQVKRIRKPMQRALVGGTALALLIAILPPLRGEGYIFITNLLNGEGMQMSDYTHFDGFLPESSALVLFLLFLVLVFKPLASAVTTGGGGCGGIFAPSLFVGAIGGYLFAQIVTFVFPTVVLSPSNFALAGMSAVLSSLLHAPLTAIFLIAEITDSYALFIPLMLASAAGYLTINYFERYSFYSKHLIERGHLIPSENRDERILSQMSVEELIEKDVLSISPKASLDDLIGLVRKSKRNIFSVLNESGTLCGIVTLDDIRDIMFDSTRKSTLVENLMSSPPDPISVKDSMGAIMKEFERTQLWNLPVQQDGKYVGFISKSRIFNEYRRLLLNFSRL